MKKTILLFAIAAIGFSSMAQATLTNRGTDTLGNRLIYDTDLNITWYDYIHDLNTWQNQVDWANNLSVSFGSHTFDDWRLPSTVDGAYFYGYNGATTAGYNTANSEMGHLFYTELGNLGYYSTSGAYQSDYGLHSTDDFQHLLSRYYWSGTEYSHLPDYAWYFDTNYGGQFVFHKGSTMYALAVRLGDVQIAPVPAPEPGTWMLLGSGFVGLVAYRKRLAGRA